jgi:hypothetical protein
MKNPIYTVAIVVALLLTAPSYAQKAEPPKPDDAALTAALALAENYRARGEAKGGSDPEKWKGRKSYEYLWAAQDAQNALWVLGRRGDDPRAERMLEDLSKIGPIHVHEGIHTIASLAREKLFELRARRQFEEWMKDKKPAEQVRKIREVLAEHEDWLNQYTRPKDKEFLVIMLVTRAVEISREQAVDLICQADMHGIWDFKYGKEMVRYAKGIGREKTLKTPNLVERIGSSGETDAVPLLRQWLKEEKREKESVELVKALGRLPGAESALKELISDPRPGVARWAKIKLGQQ